MLGRLITILGLLLWGLNAPAQSLKADSSQTNHKADPQTESLLGMIRQGEGIALGDDKNPFAGAYLPERLGRPQGGVILLHDQANHLDWPGVIHQLRTQLPAYGWSTLSIQLPEAERELGAEQLQDLIAETQRRLSISVDAFQARNIRNIVLIGHGLGGALATVYVASQENIGVRGVVAVGMDSAYFRDPQLRLQPALEQLRLPLLDLYGSQDSRAQDSHLTRLEAARRAPIFSLTGGKGYRQIQINGADHHFTGLDAPLIKRVRGWLKRHTRGKQVTRNKT